MVASGTGLADRASWTIVSTSPVVTGGVTGAGGVGQSMQDEQLKRKRELTPAVESALKKITNEDFKDLRAANDWWRKNKGSFKDPE